MFQYDFHSSSISSAYVSVIAAEHHIFTLLNKAVYRQIVASMANGIQQHIEGTVFNIQRFSIHDGPGIRTTAFLKGCPLNCRWCHNPEGILDQPELLYTEDHCTGCGACIPACTENVISRHDGKIRISKECTHCGRCVDSCTEQALEITGHTMTSDAVANALARDRVFYEESGGGITLSGGEPLNQPEFAIDILRRCKENGLHTALDTTGFVETEVILSSIPFTDLFLYDFKHPDTETHQKYTDIPIEPIVEHLKSLIEAGCNVLVRQPIVPGFNDTPDVIERTGEVLTACGVKRLQILSYHTFGKHKYGKLVRGTPATDWAVPSTEQMLAIQAILGKFPFETLRDE